MSWGDFFVVSKESYNKRLDICNACDLYNKEKSKCTKCGCYMEYKARLRNVSCPINKWGKEEIKNVG